MKARYVNLLLLSHFQVVPSSIFRTSQAFLADEIKQRRLMRHVSRPSAAEFALVSAASSAASAAVRPSLVSLHAQPHNHLRISLSREDNESANQIPITYANKILLSKFFLMSIPSSYICLLQYCAHSTS